MRQPPAPTQTAPPLCLGRVGWKPANWIFNYSFFCGWDVQSLHPNAFSVFPWSPFSSSEPPGTPRLNPESREKHTNRILPIPTVTLCYWWYTLLYFSGTCVPSLGTVRIYYVYWPVDNESSLLAMPALSTCHYSHMPPLWPVIIYGLEFQMTCGERHAVTYLDPHLVAVETRTPPHQVERAAWQFYFIFADVHASSCVLWTVFRRGRRNSIRRLRNTTLRLRDTSAYHPKRRRHICRR